MPGFFPMPKPWLLPCPSALDPLTRLLSKAAFHEVVSGDWRTDMGYTGLAWGPPCLCLHCSCPLLPQSPGLWLGEVLDK